MRHLVIITLVSGAMLAVASIGAQEKSIRIDARMDPPRWAQLERRLLADNVPACQEFYEKYFDDRGRLQCFVRWGANDGPDDAFENFNRWPELHALGGDDEILRLFSKGHEGLLRQYTEARDAFAQAGFDPVYGRLRVKVSQLKPPQSRPGAITLLLVRANEEKYQ